MTFCSKISVICNRFIFFCFSFLCMYVWMYLCVSLSLSFSFFIRTKQQQFLFVCHYFGVVCACNKWEKNSVYIWQESSTFLSRMRERMMKELKNKGISTIARNSIPCLSLFFVVNVHRNKDSKRKLWIFISRVFMFNFVIPNKIIQLSS